MFKIILEREKCIGCGTCAVICPSSFELGDDAKVNLQGGEERSEGIVKEVEDEGCNKDAVNACPVQCIHINEI